jgi:hypothetical protein
MRTIVIAISSPIRIRSLFFRDKTSIAFPFVCKTLTGFIACGDQPSDSVSDRSEICVGENRTHSRLFAGHGQRLNRDQLRDFSRSHTTLNELRSNATDGSPGTPSLSPTHSRRFFIFKAICRLSGCLSVSRLAPC